MNFKAPLINDYNWTPAYQTPNDFCLVEVTYHKLKLRGNQGFELSLIGDVHPGSHTFIQDFYESSLERINKRKNSAVIKKGDILELNTVDSPEAAMHEQVWTNQYQHDYIKEQNMGLAEDGKLWCIEEGNHDGGRSKKKIGIPQSRNMAEILRVPYSPISALHVIDFNKHRLILYSNHGKGRTTSTRTGTKRKLLKEHITYPEADIICIGHTHRLECDNLWINEEVNNCVKIDPENMCMKVEPINPPKYLITGHFLDYLKSYGQSSGYPPIPAGFPVIHLNPNGMVNVEMVWEPEWRKEMMEI